MVAFLRLIGVFIALLVMSRPWAMAGIYGYTDKDGHVHITDNPSGGRYRILYSTLKRPKGFKDPVSTGREYSPTVNQAAQQQGLTIPLLLAIIKTESNFNPRAVSPKGARGLMQLMPDTWRAYGVTDPFDPRQNIRAGSAFFRDMLRRFGGNTVLALAAYNAGPGNVEKYKGVPPFDETRRYVQKVQWYQERYQKHANLVELPGADAEFEAGTKALDTGDLDQAGRKFQRVVQAFPNSAEGHYNLALVYDRLGSRYLNQAISEYRRAIALDPYFKEAYYNLAILYERVGHYLLAIRTWQSYIKYEIRPDQLAEVRKYIRELELLPRR